MRSSMYRRGLWLASISGRVSVLAITVSILLLSLYLLGNYQSYLGSTLLALLESIRISSLVWIMSSACYLLSLLISIPYLKRLHLLRFLYSIIATASGLLVYSGTTFLLSWIVRS